MKPTGAKTLTRAIKPIAAAALLGVAVAGCAPDAEIEKYGFAPSTYAISKGYTPLMPRSFFDMRVTSTLPSTNLASRAAALRGRIARLMGPVIPLSDKRRLEQAIERNQARR